MDRELVVGPSGALDAVVAAPRLLSDLDCGARVELLKYFSFTI